MKYPLYSLGFLISWLIWIALFPFVLVAGVAQSAAQACNADWEPLLEIK